MENTILAKDWRNLSAATDKAVKSLMRGDAPPKGSKMASATDTPQNASGAAAITIPTEAERTKRHKRNPMPRTSARKLEDWLSSQWPRIQAERPTYAVTAGEASLALGFAVSPGNVQGAVGVIEKEWPAPATVGKSNAKRQTRMATVCRQLAKLCESLGEKTLPEFAALVEEMNAPVE